MQDDIPILPEHQPNPIPRWPPSQEALARADKIAGVEFNKNIFPYHDGVQERFGDPLRIDRLLNTYLGGDRKGAMQRINSPAPEIAVPAMEKLLNAISQAFGIPRFDDKTGEGVGTEDVLRGTLNKFLDWMIVKKKNIGTLPMSAPTSPAPLSPQVPLNLTNKSLASG